MKLFLTLSLISSILIRGWADLTAGDLFPVVDGDRAEEIAGLIAGGADVNARNQNGWTPLMVAASRGNLEAVNELLTAGADPSAASRTEFYSGFTALMAAAYYGHPEVAEALVKAGADPDAADNHYYGETALMLAVKGDCPDTVRVLLAGGANVNARNCQGVTALMYAASYGRLETVELLLAAGTEVGVRDNAGLDASRWSVLAGPRRAAVQMLLQSAGEQ